MADINRLTLNSLLAGAGNFAREQGILWREAGILALGQVIVDGATLTF
jgi:hypothetical protein